MFSKRISITRLSHLVIGYMILAFGWWSFHLWQQNERLYNVELQLLEAKYSKGNNGLNLTQLEGTIEYAKIVKTWRSGRRMVIAEGLFFTLCLVFGLWVINRSANRELTLARQRRNFLLSITHELKSPIASIRLVLETFTKRVLNDDQRTKLLSNGIKDADRLQQLVTDLLLAARLEDQWQPIREPLNLEQTAKDCSEALKIRFPESNIVVAHNPDLQPILVDQLGMTAVIKNLLENAVKYSPTGARIDFSAKTAANGKYQVRIADLGMGIPDTEKSRVFDKFYRVGNEETRSSSGTGLGLYIVSQVMKAHNGNIILSDNQPRGCIFTLEI